MANSRTSSRRRTRRRSRRATTGRTGVRTRTRALAARGSRGRGAREKRSKAQSRLSTPDAIYASRPQAKPRGPSTGRIAAHCLALARNLNSRQIMFVWGVCVIKVHAQYIPAPTGSEEKTCSAASAKQTRKYVWPRPAMCQPPSPQLSMARHWAATASQQCRAGRQLPPREFW